MTCFDGCGCWDIDDEHPGDLHLSGETDGARWPRVRLPLALYDKLFRHQRIGVQWMASLHGNEIGGGILADDMGLGKTMQTLAYLGVAHAGAYNIQCNRGLSEVGSAKLGEVR